MSLLSSRSVSPAPESSSADSSRVSRLVKLAGRDPIGAASFAFLVVLVILAIGAPWFSPYNPNVSNYNQILSAPSASHWLGTDQYGRDIFSRLLYGARVSLLVAFSSTLVAGVVGCALGMLSGYVGGFVDSALSRIFDVIIGFPSILIALILLAALQPGIRNIVIAIGVAFTAPAFRVTRGVVHATCEQAHVEAAHAAGASHLRVMIRHVLPSARAPMLVVVAAQLGGAVILESSLSYLGLGVPPPTSSWGGMLSETSLNYALTAPWLVLVPTLAIVALVFAFNSVADMLRDAWDTKLDTAGRR
jgi:peptide/nickel transport system permease protein